MASGAARSARATSLKWLHAATRPFTPFDAGYRRGDRDVRQQFASPVSVPAESGDRRRNRNTRDCLRVPTLHAFHGMSKCMPTSGDGTTAADILFRAKDRPPFCFCSVLFCVVRCQLSYFVSCRGCSLLPADPQTAATPTASRTTLANRPSRRQVCYTPTFWTRQTV